MWEVLSAEQKTLLVKQLREMSWPTEYGKRFGRLSQKIIVGQPRGSLAPNTEKVLADRAQKMFLFDNRWKCFGCPSTKIFFVR
jgi:hypothetical protein